MTPLAPITISPFMREKDPAFATLVGSFNGMLERFNLLRQQHALREEVLRAQDAEIAQLKAEVAMLRATKKAAA
jgi:hypothetical protein